MLGLILVPNPKNGPETLFDRKHNDSNDRPLILSSDLKDPREYTSVGRTIIVFVSLLVPLHDRSLRPSIPLSPVVTTCPGTLRTRKNRFITDTCSELTPSVSSDSNF